MTAIDNKRPAAISVVMPFVFRHWLRQPLATLIVACGLLGATVADLFVPVTLKIMSDVARDAFARVQRFSTDWHANSFAGSTVRKVTRGMWALDLYNDTILLALLPSLMVLLGSMVLLGLHWASLGLVIAVGALIYVVMTVALSTRY